VKEESMDDMFWGDMLFGFLTLLVIWYGIGVLIWVSTGHKKEGIIVMLAWPYVVYTPEGTDWYYKKIGLK
jgi:uncharacterized RDD family membrane protein YckC